MITILKRLRFLAVKEMLAVLRDPRSRMVLIVPPLIQLLVLSYAATLEVDSVRLGIFDRDSGKWSAELIQRLDASQTFEKMIYVYSNREAGRLIEEQKAIGVLVLPDNFSKRINSGRSAEVQILLDGRKTNSSQIVNGYIGTIIKQFNMDRGRPQRGAVLAGRNWFNPNLEYLWYTVPSLVCILSLLIALLVTALSVAREREMGTFEQLLVSPLRAGEILAGKSLAALMIALVEGSLFIMVAVFLFRIPFEGSLLLLYPSFIVFLLAVIGVGLFISSLSMTQQQAILGAMLFMSPAVLLSGFATPIANMPEWLQVVTTGNPLRWALVVTRGIFLKNIPADAVWSNTWPLIIIAVVTLAAASWLFRKRME